MLNLSTSLMFAKRQLTIGSINTPKFLKSLKNGKEIADMNVANSLYNRAIGYEVTDTKRKFKTVIVDVVSNQIRSHCFLRGYPKLAKLSIQAHSMVGIKSIYLRGHFV
ncbi:MAG: hypothetical protein HRU29_16180 [Rhizobiales bacterium]|nr:hypothetical protein [Hyphomicrobiales bacterium]NRB15931.1 hypothetical protein [Hyphomicrobiales bacterium]